MKPDPRGRPRKPISWDELPEVMNAEEYAAFMRVDKQSVYEAIQRGEIPVFRFGRTIRIPKQKIAAMLGYTNENTSAVS